MSVEESLAGCPTHLVQLGRLPEVAKRRRGRQVRPQERDTSLARHSLELELGLASE